MTSPATSARKGNLIWVGLVVAIVVIGAIAVLASKGSKDDDGGSAGGTTTTLAPSTAPVQVTGVPLDPFGDGEDTAVGKVIPAVSGRTLDGERITIGPADKGQIIVFVAHWCPHCQREVPRIVEHLKTNPLPPDVGLATVSTSVNPDAGNYPPKAWLDKEQWPVPALADSPKSEAAQAYGLASFPYFVVVDKDGKVVVRTSGELTTDQWDALVKAAQTGEPPA